MNLRQRPQIVTMSKCLALCTMNTQRYCLPRYWIRIALDMLVTDATGYSTSEIDDVRSMHIGNYDDVFEII